VPAIRPETLVGREGSLDEAGGRGDRPVGGGEGATPPTLVITRLERLPVGSELRERLWLLDPQPLFLPDERGDMAGSPGLLGGRRESVATRSVPPAFHYPESAPARGISPPQVPASPAIAAVQVMDTRWFRGMARQEAADRGEASAIRLARVEVYPADDREVVAAADITSASGIGPGVWRPLTLTVLVNATGSVGQPTLVTSSGVDEIDERIRWIVGRELLPRLPLRPGIYRLEVGP
jgi:hypothetical protein